MNLLSTKMTAAILLIPWGFGKWKYSWEKIIQGHGCSFFKSIINYSMHTQGQENLSQIVLGYLIG